MKKAGHKCPAFLGISGGTWLQQMQIMNAPGCGYLSYCFMSHAPECMDK